MRYWELDFARGIAIAMMVVFHFLFDLNYLGFAKISLYEGLFGIWQKLIASLFLFIVGVVIAVKYSQDGGNFWKNSLKRAEIIFGAALIVTIGTFAFFPQEFIYFGILHLIAVSILISIPLARYKYLNLILGLVLIAIPLFVNTFEFEIPFLVWVGLATPIPTFDFFPLIPWFGVVLLGIATGNFFYGNENPKIVFVEPKNRFSEFFVFLGKNSFAIYLVHQPVLFGALYIISSI
ncbi:MAG TPA: heparan-alpha-glucosaminide N-acetyltransferase [archaeon]|nr:heparan-alpha-glucosaminide N-acetyltransferase [archaeon]